MGVRLSACPVKQRSPILTLLAAAMLLPATSASAQPEKEPPATHESEPERKSESEPESESESEPKSQSEPEPKPEPAPSASTASAPLRISRRGLRVAGLQLRLELQPRFRIRSTPNASDRDAYGLLVAELGDPRRDRLSAAVLARAAWDVGASPGESEEELRDLDDTTGEAYARIYHAYVEGRRLGALESLRAGRIFLDGLPEWLHFDGAHLRSRPLHASSRTRVEAYGGVPVHLYQGSRLGDFVAGSAVTSRPWAGAQLRADWELLADGNYADGQRNHIYGATLRQRLRRSVTIMASAHGVGDRPRDARARAVYVGAEAGLVARLDYFQLLSTRRTLALSGDRLNGVLYDERRFWQVSGLVEKQIGRRASLGAGADLRQLADPDDSAPLSHSFQRYWLGPRVRKWPTAAFEIGATSEIWYSPGDSGGTVTTVGGDVTYRLNRTARFRLGSDYARYRYDFFLGQEHEDSRRFYVAADARHRRWGLRGRVRYELESALSGTFHTLWLTAGVRL